MSAEDRSQRIQGFVVGSDERAGKTMWTVREKTVEGKGRKFRVESVMPLVVLRSGLAVTFFVHEFFEGGIPVLKAVDVAPAPVKERKRKPGTIKQESASLMVTAARGSGISACLTGFATRGEAERFINDSGSDETLLAFVPIKPDSPGMNAILSLLDGNDQFSAAQEHLLTEAFVWGALAHASGAIGDELLNPKGR